MADPQQSANENSETTEGAAAAGGTSDAAARSSTSDSPDQVRSKAEELRAAAAAYSAEEASHAGSGDPREPAYGERVYDEEDYYGSYDERDYSRARTSPSSASPLDTLEQNANLGIELGRFWIAQNLTTSMLGAFAAGVFIGYMVRR